MQFVHGVVVVTYPGGTMMTMITTGALVCTAWSGCSSPASQPAVPGGPPSPTFPTWRRWWPRSIPRASTGCCHGGPIVDDRERLFAARGLDMMTVRGQVRAQPARHRRRGRRRRRRHRRLGELLRAGTQARRHRHEPAAGPQLRGTGGAHPHQPHLRNPVGHPGRDNPEAGTPADRPAGIRGAAGGRQ